MFPWHAKSLELSEALEKARISWPAISRVENLGVACSGGADSLCLLLLVYARTRETGTPLSVLHLNHGQRGDAAEADAAFVADIASTLGLEFVYDTLTEAPAKASEAWLREKRLAFYHQSGLGHIFLGHHANDVAETMLMRLTRGSGTAGLCAPRPQQRLGESLVLHRPLLSLGREEIEQALRDCGVPWREDASNGSEAYFRNRMRANVVPNLLESAPGNALAGFSRARQLLEEDETALDVWLSRFGLHYDSGEVFDCRPLQDFPIALWRRALQRWLLVQNHDEHLSAAAVDKLLHEAHRGHEVQVSAGEKREIAFRGGFFYQQETLPSVRWETTQLEPGSELELPGGRTLMVDVVKLDALIRNKICAGGFSHTRCVYLDMAAITLPLTIRHWEEGDRYRPLGSPGTRKLQDCFTDVKIPPVERRSRPVVQSGNGDILWCPGLLPADAAKIGLDTPQALRLTYRRH